MTTTTPTLVKIEDHEFDGTCRHCGREGVRWICTLSDGSTVGVECAKKLMGWKLTPKSYSWASDFAPVAEYAEGQNVYVLWQHKAGTATRTTLNGNLVAVGGQRQTWAQRGWL